MEEEDGCHCGGGTTEADGCYDDEGFYSSEDPSYDVPGLPGNAPGSGSPQVIRCKCHWGAAGAASGDGWSNFPPQKEIRFREPLDYNVDEEYAFPPVMPGSKRVKFDQPPVTNPKRDICDLPHLSSPVENPTIPYPRPAPSVELRGGQIYSGCQCLKRDGLQHDCPRTGCQGRDTCLAYPAPVCVPSGNAPETPPPPPRKRQHMRGLKRPQGTKKWQARDYQPVGDDDPYVRLARQGYRENPPVDKSPKVPCKEHRKPRC